MSDSMLPRCPPSAGTASRANLFRGSNMKTLRAALLGLAALAGFTFAAASAEAACRTGDCWGAVAYSERGAWAYAYNFPTREIAGQRAQAKCNGQCTHILTFHNSCGAYATGPRGNFYYGWGNASTRRQAESIALSE